MATTYCVLSSFRSCRTPCSLSLKLRLFLNSSPNWVHWKIQKSSRDSQKLPLKPFFLFSFKQFHLALPVLWKTASPSPVFLPWFIWYSAAIFIFQKMGSFSSYQNFLHSRIKSILLNLAFNDFQIIGPIYLYGLITIYSNYTSLGFCQINLVSSNLSWVSHWFIPFLPQSMSTTPFQLPLFTAVL